MANVRVVPRSLTDAYKRREGDFAPNLVGFQFTNGVSLFTFGNFEITTNLDSRLNVNYTLGGQWSDYYNLDNLNLSQTESNIFQSNELFVKLNFNPFNINRYVYFGSFGEFVRVTIEEIIQSWKGSLYLNPTTNSNFPVNTVLSFSYDSGNGVARFLIPKSVAVNKFQLIVDDNQNFTQSGGDIYNISRDYNKYVIWNIQDNKEFPVIGYTGSTDSYPYLVVETKGNPFPSLTASTFGQTSYHLKPNATEVQLFFEQLSDFESVILNRLTSPIYKASFEVPKESDGVFYNSTESFTWPVSDGYNLDIDTRGYALYVESILASADNFDKYKTDLMSRRFVSESIHEFDTNGGTATSTGDEIYGMKVSKMLRIYGREYDEVKKYIDGISFANVVTYNKLDNTSDELIKIIAKNLGFDVLLTVTTNDFNLKQQVQPSFETPFSGYSRSLSAKELDIELWRRLVINAWWLFRSKGTRKVIEFFFNLFKIPECMVSLNEYVYLADNRLNTTEVYEKLNQIYGGPNLFNVSDLPMDDYGFPRVLPETQDNYFQMDGFWYNGGNTSSIGNNPHIGPYDFGKSYFNQFECFVPNFEDLLTASTLVTVVKNYFENYNKGTFIYDENGLPVPYYGTSYADTLNDGLVDNVIVNSAGLTSVGDENAPKYGRPSGDTFSMKISFTAGKSTCDPCTAYELYFGDDGIVYISGNPTKPLDNVSCCKQYWLSNERGYNCYWCPPVDYIQKICSVDDYLRTLTDAQKIQLAINLGSPNNVSVREATNLIVSVYSDFFRTYGCLLLDGEDNVIRDKDCCYLRGGTLTHIDGTNYCIIPNTNPCDGSQIIGGTHLWSTVKGDLLPQSCCNRNQQYWVSRVSENGDNITLRSRTITTTFLDVPGSTFAKSTSYCSACPNNLMEVQVSTNRIEIQDSNGSDLSKQCCYDYGFNWDGNSSKCTKCPIDVRYGTTLDRNLIVDLDGNDLSQECCQIFNGWYGRSTSYDVDKCFSCPSTMVFDQNGKKITNPDYRIINGEVTYGGSSLSDKCCDFYSRNIGPAYFDSRVKKCFFA